jgi:aminoglycoside phosphotransferase (APT) family kinase protein
VEASRGSIGPVQGADGFGLVPLDGGFSGETFLAEVAGERTVVRLYGERGARRGPDAPAVDAAVLRLVRGLLPVPEVLEVRRPDAGTGAPGVLVTAFLPGSRLDLLLPGLDGDARRTLGHRLGALLARLATMPMPRAGRFADETLRIEPWGVADLADLVAAHRAGTAIGDWPAEEYDGLLRVADRSQDVLDEVTRTCLVHSDLNPKNLLVDPETLTVTGVLDWEFAHAGTPGADLGNLLRFEREPVLARAVLESYTDAVPDAGERPLDRARAADLVALVDLAARRGENPVTERAHDLLVAVARTGDLHAVPEGWRDA